MLSGQKTDSPSPAQRSVRTGAQKSKSSFSPFPPLRPVNPSIHSPYKISCNFLSRFPLYGVEASSLPAKAVEHKELNVNKD